MKAISIFAAVAVSLTPAFAQRTAVVRGIGTQTCSMYVAATQADKQLALQGRQWILGTLTGYFRQANDDPTRLLGDDLLIKTVVDVCTKNADKTIDEAVSIAITALPASEVKKPSSK